MSYTLIGFLRKLGNKACYSLNIAGKRVRPPGLPKGGLRIFAGFSNWEEL